jgi:hypothetical protein
MQLGGGTVNQPRTIAVIGGLALAAVLLLGACTPSGGEVETKSATAMYEFSLGVGARPSSTTCEASSTSGSGYSTNCTVKGKNKAGKAVTMRYRVASTYNGSTAKTTSYNTTGSRSAIARCAFKKVPNGWWMQTCTRA